MNAEISILFCSLAGTPPFWHRKQIFMLRRIMEGNYSFPSPDWDCVSVSAKDLVSKAALVFKVDNGIRLTMV